MPSNSGGASASSASSSSNKGRFGCRARKNLIAARPSRPSPQIATRAAPSSAARIEHGHKSVAEPDAGAAPRTELDNGPGRPSAVTGIWRAAGARRHPLANRDGLPDAPLPRRSRRSRRRTRTACARASRTARQTRRIGLSSSSMSRPKIAISSVLATNGARARNTKRHFGQSQHHCRPRSAGDCRNAVLQLRKLPKYRRYRAKRRAISISDNGRNSEK